MNYLKLQEVMPWSILELSHEIDRVSHLSFIPLKLATAHFTVFYENSLTNFTILDSHTVLFR